MAVVQCANAHYYDNEKYPQCPHCAAQAGASGKEPGDSVERFAAEYVRQSQKKAGMGQTERQNVPEAPKDTKGCTAGWLVCIKGAQYGRDFPLYEGFNRIGRDVSNDIVLTDPKVAGQEHCSVVYEKKKNVFYLYPKSGNLTYRGEEAWDCATELEGGQTITLGDTMLELVVFCIGEKRWEIEEKGQQENVR